MGPDDLKVQYLKLWQIVPQTSHRYYLCWLCYVPAALGFRDVVWSGVWYTVLLIFPPDISIALHHCKTIPPIPNYYHCLIHLTRSKFSYYEFLNIQISTASPSNMAAYIDQRSPLTICLVYYFSL